MVLPACHDSSNVAREMELTAKLISMVNVTMGRWRSCNETVKDVRLTTNDVFETL